MFQSYTTTAENSTDEWTIPHGATARATKQPALLPLEYTPERFEGALEAVGVEFRYNCRSLRTQYRRIPYAGELPADWGALSGWQDWTDTVAVILRAELKGAAFGDWRGNYTNGRLNTEDDTPPLHFTLDLNDKQFAEGVKLAAAQNQVDPFLDYLRGEIPRWDGLPRLDGWLIQCFDVANGSYDLAEWASEFILLGAIQRAMKPGCKLDEVPVLIGPGGIGKSTALRELFPPELQDLFTDGLNLSSDTKTRVEALQGRAIVELAEMAGARRADIESLKAFISRTDDGSVRLTWRHNPEPLPRRCIIVGTADRSDPLPPDHNLRRFVPVSLTSGDVGQLLAFMDANRGQLWAEALHLYESGQDARLPDWLKEQQREATDAARPTDAIQDGVERYLEDAHDQFTLEAVAYAIRLIDQPDDGAKITPADQQRIGAALRHFGYQKARRRVGGKLKNVYSR